MEDYSTKCSLVLCVVVLRKRSHPSQLNTLNSNNNKTKQNKTKQKLFSWRSSLAAMKVLFNGLPFFIWFCPREMRDGDYQRAILISILYFVCVFWMGGILKLISCLSQFLELIPPFLFCIYWTLIGCTPVASNFFIYFREKLTRRNWHVDVCLFGSSISARQTQVFFFSFHIRFFFFFVYKDLPPPPPPQPAAIVFYTLTKNLLFWFFYVLVEDVGGD